LPELTLPERHLGLVQAGEHKGLDAFLERAAEVVAENLDLVGLRALARPASIETADQNASTLPPLGQRIAVARDVAFAFCYPFHLEGWQAAGAEISFFSPLADEAPDRLADTVYLPGGYPELHAGKLSGNSRFLAGLRAVAAKWQTLYGECGGYMVLGEGLKDEAGICHPMAGLLPVSTSFAQRRRHLGYRRLRLLEASPLGTAGTGFRGHEFHYASITDDARATPLFACEDASGNKLQAQGARRENVMGSFIHLIDREG
jgi:cobyrinic acid a,c-diamide synthase